MKQIYFLLFLFSILSLAYCHKTTLHHFKYETKCPQDPFDVKFFYKMPNNSSLKSSHQNLDDSTTNLPPPLETPPPESQPQSQETFTSKVFGGIGNFFKKIPSTVSHHAQQVGEKAKEFSHKAFGNAKEAGSKTVSFISSNIASGVNNIKGKAKDVTESIEKKAHHGWEVIKETSKSVENAAESIGEKAKETSKSFGEKVVNVSKKIVDSVKDIGSKAKESIISGVKGTVNHLKEDTEKVSDTVKEGLKKVPEVIVNAANSVGEKGKDVFNKIKDPASNLGGKIKNTVSKGVCTLLDGLKSIPRKASEGVSSARNLIPNEVPQSLKNLKTTVKDFFTSLPQKGSVIKEKFQKVKSFIGEKIEDIVKFVGGKKDRIISKAKEGAFTVKNVVWDGTGWLFSSLWDKLYKVIIGVGLILGLYIFIQIRPFLLFLLDVLSLFKCKRSKGNEPASKVSKPQPTSTVNNEEREMRSPGVRKNQAVKLAKEEFEVNCVSLKANKITNNDTLCFLRYHLHYEISHFPTLEGEVLLKLTTKVGNDVKCSDIFKIPAEEFVCRSIWDGCSFQNCVDKYVEDVNVRLCVDFKGHNGQYFSIYSRDFEIVF